jgi:hypothetical protein
MWIDLASAWADGLQHGSSGEAPRIAKVKIETALLD